MVIAVLVSPLMVLKPSRRQKHIVALREEARRLGLQVQIMANGVTGIGDGYTPVVRYQLPWLAKDLQGDGFSTWLLIRDDGRGETSQWPGWRWFGVAAPQTEQLAITELVRELPGNLNGLSIDTQGVGVYWSELGELASVGKIDAILREISLSIKRIL